jgi:hypothetical protein
MRSGTTPTSRKVVAVCIRSELVRWQRLYAFWNASGSFTRAETLLRGSFGNRTLPQWKIRGEPGTRTVKECVATSPAATIEDNPAMARMIAAILAA